MTIQVIPDDNHVSRYVKPTQITETLRGICKPNSHVFRLRADYPPETGPEEFVSVDWLEYFKGDLSQQLNDICLVLKENRGFKVSLNGGFAIVQVGDVKDSDLGRTITVKTLGEQLDPSHSGIYGLKPEDDIVAQKIANRARFFKNTYCH
ncbi:MAG TPA: hypothetical protein DCY27_11695 [Desulfobacterales bacterium]|nr:hypothetical protein [Desulfobacterales bacterium]